MYWNEFIESYGVDSLQYALPFAFFLGGSVYSLLKDKILARKDVVTDRYWELIKEEYSWGNATTPLEAVNPSFVHSRPLSPDRLNGLALELAPKFGGKGMRFAMAHYLAPSLLSSELAVNGKQHMADFTRSVLEWGDSNTSQFRLLLFTEFARYSSGVLAAAAWSGTSSLASRAGGVPTAHGTAGPEI